MKFVNVPNLIASGTVLNTTINSTAQSFMDLFGFSIQVVITGTPTGTIKLQMSDDISYSGKPTAGGTGLNAPPVNWTDIANSSFTVTAAGNVAWDYSWPGFNWVRVQFTDTSGGTSTATVTSSTFNGKGS
jgi:hypothetical protein